jgi:putative ABC transport system permease protein
VRDWEQYVRTHLSLPGLVHERESRIVRELSSQLEDFYREAVAGGMTEGEADAHARAQVTDWTQLASTLTDVDRPHARGHIDRWSDGLDDRAHEKPGRWHVMNAFAQDLKYAMRSLGKQPGFAALAIAMLAVGIGATVAIFALTFAVLYKPLPFTEPSRLMLVHLLAPDREAPGVSSPMIWSYPKYRVFREHQQVFESSSTFTGWTWNLTGAGAPEQVTGELVDGTYLPLLGVAPQLGRSFNAEETQAGGSPKLAVIAHGFWLNRLGSDPGVLGRSIGLNGVPYTIIGVLPEGFRGLTGQAELFVPVTTQAAADLDEKWNHTYWVVARRRPDVTVEQAEAAARVLGGVVSREIGEPSGKQRLDWGATAVSLNDERVDPLIRRSVLLLLAAVGSVLLIVCLNLANLTLARGMARAREVAIRSALGASRLRIMRQLMAESVVLALVGGILGTLVAYGALSAGAAFLPDLRMVLPRNLSAGLTRVGLSLLGVDLAAFAGMAGVTSLAALLFGLGPAWRASRRDPIDTMKTGTSGSVSHGTRGLSLRNLLVVGEMAIALVVLTAGGLMVKSVLRLQATDLGFQPRSLLTVRMVLPGPQYNPARASQFIMNLIERLESRPGMESVAFGSCAPVSGGCNRTSAKLPGGVVPPHWSDTPIGVVWASPRYFETMGIRLVRGRLFTPQDRTGQPKVVVVNETAARTYWRGEDPIGKRIALGQGGFGDGAEVVGIVADVRYGAVETTVGPDAYLPLLQTPRAAGFLFVRTDGGPEPIIPQIRAEVQALDPNLPLIDVKMMASRFGEATWRQRSSAWLLAIFSLFALTLAATGIYAVMSQGVEQRRREIGVRLALGAGRSDILRLIIGRVTVMAIAGIALGLLIAVPAMQLLRALLYQVTPGDPTVFVALASVVLAVTLLAGYIPARRATRVDPLVTLRAE